MPLNEVAEVKANTLAGPSWPLGKTDGAASVLTMDPSGAAVVMDFYLKAMLAGRGFQVRAGTITTPLVGDVVLTDTAAEYCVDPPAGYTILPVSQMISLRLLTGTLHEYATKGVNTASSAGTAFVPLPLNQASGVNACLSTARVSAAGGVTVTAELATTTRRYWEGANPAAGATTSLPTGLYTLEWTPRTPPPIISNATARCLYTQIAATGTGPSYYAHLDFLEFISQMIGLS